VSDFLTRARERGFVVPDIAFKLALDRLKNYTGNAEEPSKNGGRALAYALYVLARNGAALGDSLLRRHQARRLRPPREGTACHRAWHAR
jgi:uncharacterized protein YfaS (alpha-2-macroglobulin family)